MNGRIIIIQNRSNQWPIECPEKTFSFLWVTFVVEEPVEKTDAFKIGSTQLDRVITEIAGEIKEPVILIDVYGNGRKRCGYTAPV